MKIGFVINDFATELAPYTSTLLAVTAMQRGHEIFVMSVADFALDPDDRPRARAVAGCALPHPDPATWLDAVQHTSERERVDLSQLDVLLLRNDPAEDTHRPWAQRAGIVFGQLALAHGVLVANDPVGLADAVNKMYFQHFPESVRPRTLITRDADEVRRFVEEEGGRAVLKPLQGSGGRGVFFVGRDDTPNLDQMVEAIARDDYVICQEYLKEAQDGDVRLMLCNGEPLVSEGKMAVFRRRGRAGTGRTNLRAGGTAEAVEPSEVLLQIARTVRPKLVRDGMFLVALDVVGDKLMEINVFSPGGLAPAQRVQGVDYTIPVIESLERKIELRDSYPHRLENKFLATL
jgi:glutathione synthase